jgi:integrase
MPLTDVRIRQAKPAAKPFRLADSGGLLIEVRPNGSKLWRYAYRIGGKPNLFALGAYPEVTLQDARTAHAKARALVQAGTHPAHDRARALGAAVSASGDHFRAVAEEWIDAKITKENRPGWSAKYEDQVRSYFDRDVYPKVGRRPIRSITSAEWLAVVRAIADRGAESAAILVRQLVSQVYVYAVSNLRADIDPTWPIRRAIIKPQVQHASAQDRDTIRDMLQRVAAYGGNRTTTIALGLLLRTFVRTVELRRAPWSEFDLDAALWTIPAERMKKRRIHLVPLAPQVVELLRELHDITGANVHLFPNNRRPKDVMTATTVNRALEHMGYPSGYFTGHDFRATASTHLHEMGYRSDVVEMQMAHAKTDKVGAAYNHAEYLPERIAMMKEWSEWIEQAGADESPIRRKPGPKSSKRAASRRAR